MSFNRISYVQTRNLAALKYLLYNQYEVDHEAGINYLSEVCGHNSQNIPSYPQLLYSLVGEQYTYLHFVPVRTVRMSDTPQDPAYSQDAKEVTTVCHPMIPARISWRICARLRSN